MNEDLIQVLQKVVSNIVEKVVSDKLECLQRNSLLSAKTMLTLEDVAALTGLSKTYIYKLTHQHTIPFYRPNGKCLYFNKAEIEAWMQQNRSTSEEEAMQQALAYELNKCSK